VAVFRGQQLALEGVCFTIFDVGGQQLVDELLAVVAALAELDIDDDLGGVLKAGLLPPPARAPRSQSHLRRCCLPTCKPSEKPILKR
jgi:hypothetical protein